MNQGKNIAVGLAVVVLVGAGGYALDRHLTCSTMEEDYLNAFSTVRNSGAFHALGDKRLSEIGRDLEASGRENLERLTKEISVTCGDRAMQTALRKAGDSIHF